MSAVILAPCDCFAIVLGYNIGAGSHSRMRGMEVDGMKLKELREERALSQRGLAALSGVSPDTIGRVERGDRRAYPSTARRLADALGVEPKELMRKGGGGE